MHPKRRYKMLDCKSMQVKTGLHEKNAPQRRLRGVVEVLNEQFESEPGSWWIKQQGALRRLIESGHRLTRRRHEAQTRSQKGDRAKLCKYCDTWQHPQAAAETVFTVWSHCFQPTVLEHKKGGQAAQRIPLRLSLDAQATAEREAKNGRRTPGAPWFGRRSRVCVAMILHGVQHRSRL